MVLFESVINREKKMEYKIKVNITLDDYKRFNYDYMTRKKIVPICLIICLVLIIVNFLIELFTANNITHALTKNFPAIAVILFWILFWFVLFPLRIKRIYNSDKVLQEEREIILTEQGISDYSSRGSFTYYVQDFTRVFFGKTVISIFVSSQKAILIPKHCFNSKEEEIEVEQFIRNNYSKNI